MTVSQERRTRRIPYQTPVGGILLEGEQRVLSMVSTNLSQGGMFVDMDQAPAIGAELVCNIATSGGLGAIQLRGRIAWYSHDGGVGIEFVDLSSEQATELDALVGNKLEIPRGEQSAAVYELMELEGADTTKTVVDEVLMAKAIAATAPVVKAELVIEETDQIRLPHKQNRWWLLAAAAGAGLALLLGLGMLSSDSTTKKSASSQETMQGERDRVRALVEGETSEEQRRETAIERIRAAALAEPAAEPEPPAEMIAADLAIPEVVPEELARSSQAEPTNKRRQTLGGVVIKENSESFTVRLPFSGTLKGENHYEMKDPPAFAINLPYAQPGEGYSQALEPHSEQVRLMWVRERLGGLHLRVFFHDGLPECKLDLRKADLVLRCQR